MTKAHVNGSSRNKDKAKLKFKGYVPAYLVKKEEAEEAFSTFSDSDEVLNYLEQLVLDGYTVKLTPSMDGERVYVDVGGTDVAVASSKGRYLSSFGSDLATALAVTFFRHFKVFEGHWPDSEAAEYG